MKIMPKDSLFLGLFLLFFCNYCVAGEIVWKTGAMYNSFKMANGSKGGDNFNSLEMILKDSVYVKEKNKVRVALFGGSFCTRAAFSVIQANWKEKLNFEIDNYSRTGAGFSSKSSPNNIPRQVNEAIQSKKKYDLYVFWASSNDYVKAQKFLGSVNDYTSYDAWDNERLISQCGGINYSLKQISDFDSLAKIVFFSSTPIFNKGENGYKLDSVRENCFYAFVEKQKKICEKWKIPFFDLFELGVIDADNYVFFTEQDHRHLNSNGYLLFKDVSTSFLDECLQHFWNERILDIKKKYGKIFLKQKFMHQAHRGLSSLYPENTKLAFEKAAESDYDGIETDVWMTSDGVIVCHHDQNIDRTTNGFGKICDYTYEELQKFFIDGGLGWNENFAEKLKIPMLSDFLQICKKHDKVPYIELKLGSKNGIEMVVETIRKSGFEDGEYVLTSFNENTLKIARSICNTPLELLGQSFDEKKIKEISKKISNIIIRPEARFITSDVVKNAANYGVLVECWKMEMKNIGMLQNFGVVGGTDL